MLAAILVLDQFPRNMFRRDARYFVTDAPALALAKRAIAEGLDAKLRPEQRMFLYMPFQHAEDKDDQARAVALVTMLGNPLGLDFALRHQAIFDRFGRFPHRNANFHTGTLCSRGRRRRRSRPSWPRPARPSEPYLTGTTARWSRRKVTLQVWSLGLSHAAPGMTACSTRLPPLLPN